MGVQAKAKRRALRRTQFDCSAWVGELEAALRILVSATPPTEYAHENPARYDAMVLLNRLDSERRSSPTDKISSEAAQ